MTRRKTARKPQSKAAIRGAGGLPAEKRVQQMTREIGLRILAAGYKPGETIPVENEFCAELGVSRPALREAIKLLTAKGMVTPRVKVGTAVNPRSEWNYLDPTLLEWLLAMGDVGPFLLKLSELRKALEPAAASLAAQNATFEDFERLHRAFEDMAASTRDLDAWAAADLRFHQAVYLATHNEFFWPIGRLLEPALVAGFRVTGSAGNHRQCVPEHRELRDAILARDPSRSYQAAVDLMRTSHADLVQVLSAGDPKSIAKPKARARIKGARDVRAKTKAPAG
jgi:DNA-binding FadR family transcriptional regulator